MPLETRVEEERDLIQVIQLYKDILKEQERFFREVQDCNKYTVIAKAAVAGAVCLSVLSFSITPLIYGVFGKFLTSAGLLATGAGTYTTYTALDTKKIKLCCDFAASNHTIQLALNRPETVIQKLWSKVELFHSNGVLRSKALCYLIFCIKLKKQWQLIDQSVVSALINAKENGLLHLPNLYQFMVDEETDNLSTSICDHFADHPPTLSILQTDNIQLDLISSQPCVNSKKPNRSVECKPTERFLKAVNEQRLQNSRKLEDCKLLLHVINLIKLP